MIDLKTDLEKKHSISPYLYMQFMEPLGVADSSVDAGWDFDNNKWFDGLIDCVRELSPTMVRFGGCFASYYHWREAVGDYKKRIPMRNHCWSGIYHNLVGTHEVIDFCKKVGAEPLFVANMESEGLDFWQYPKNDSCRKGTDIEAADWVSYCNDPDSRERISNGIKEPYNVKYWQVGNETSYGVWGIPGFTLDECFETTERFAKAMRNRDPSIKLIGWADEAIKTKENWCKRMSEAEGIDMLAFHHHFGTGRDDTKINGTAYRDDADITWEYMLSAYKSLDEQIKRMREDCGGKRLAMTEGHFGLKGRNRNEVLSSWTAGVAYARCLNTIMRHSDVLDIATMADFFGSVWQVNAVMIPTPFKENKRCYLQPVGSVMSLFGRHQGSCHIDCSYSGAVDAVASATGNKVFIHLVNTDMHASQMIRLNTGREIKNAKMYYIAQNPTKEITMLEPDAFAVSTVDICGDTVTVPKAAVCAIEIEL